MTALRPSNLVPTHNHNKCSVTRSVASINTLTHTLRC
jgi:hypothetical protein